MLGSPGRSASPHNCLGTGLRTCNLWDPGNGDDLTHTRANRLKTSRMILQVQSDMIIDWPIWRVSSQFLQMFRWVDVQQFFLFVDPEGLSSWNNWPRCAHQGSVLLSETLVPWITPLKTHSQRLLMTCKCQRFVGWNFGRFNYNKYISKLYHWPLFSNALNSKHAQFYQKWVA